MMLATYRQTAFEFVFWAEILLRVESLERGYKDILATASVSQESIDGIKQELGELKTMIQKNQDLNIQRFYEIQERIRSISERA
jgi:prephenate dehydrogenase